MTKICFFIQSVAHYTIVVLLCVFSHQLAFAYKTQTEYIYNDIDLKGKVLTWPEGTTLVFKGGVIRNGKIVGNRTKIKAKAELLFDNVVVGGTWENTAVYSQWLPFRQGVEFDNAENFNNLMLLCTGKEMTHLYMQEGIYFCSVKKNHLIFESLLTSIGIILPR